MATSTHPAPTLNDDILTMIFMGIVVREALTSWNLTPAGQPTALDTVRLASQVCPRWRKCLLGSPGIWAKLIHLDGKVKHGSKRLQWMDCVMERAQSAPLWIYGDIRKPTKRKRFDAFRYFTKLLGSHWERIEHFSVAIIRQHFDMDYTARELIKLRLLSPAPSLKLFRLHFQFLDDNTPGPTDSSTFQLSSEKDIFAGSSPMLQEVYMDSFFVLASSSVSQIRKLVYRDLKTLANVVDVLTLFQDTPLIECVELGMRSITWNPETTAQPQHCSLPHLSSVTLEGGSLSLLPRILDCIHGATLSILSISVQEDIISLGSPDRALLRRTLASYISRYFTSKPLEIANILISNGCFKFWDDADEDKYFRIQFSSKDATEGWATLSSFLFDTVSLSSTSEMGTSTLFESVTQMKLPFIEVRPTTIQKFRSMLALFPNVRHLVATEDYGATLVDLAFPEDPVMTSDGGSQYILFPHLHTLHLRTRLAENTSTELTDFLIKRKEQGYPVKIFDLTECDASNYAQDLSRLECVDGLEVRWRKKDSESGEEDDQFSRYICGTGKAEEVLINLVLNEEESDWDWDSYSE